jgi:transposase
VVVRLRWHQPTRDYLARRLKQGKSRKEIIRCLKRYVAREVFAVLHQMANNSRTQPLDIYTSVEYYQAAA